MTDFRSKIDCRCFACGLTGAEVQWGALGSSYENGHFIPGSVPDVCGPMLLTADYDLMVVQVADKSIPAQDRVDAMRAAIDRCVDTIDLLEYGVGA